MKRRNGHFAVLAAALAFSSIAALAHPIESARASGLMEQSAEAESTGLGTCTTGFDLEPLLGDPVGADAAASDLPTVVTIPVHFHVVSKGPLVEDGNVPDEWIEEQVDVLNDAYAGGQGGAATRYRFEKISVDRVVNPAWHRASMGTPEADEMMLALHVGDARTLNVYISGSGAGGQAMFPWFSKDTPYRDAVIIHWLTMPGRIVSVVVEGNPANSVNLHNEGDVLVHEVGHWLGLYHTFEWGCGGFRNLDGDGVDDTPAHQQPTFDDGFDAEIDNTTDAVLESECAQTDTCPAEGLDPVRNFMNYIPDRCRSEFTRGQVERMDKVYAKYRLRAQK
jgi:hypothetical protein